MKKIKKKKKKGEKKLSKREMYVNRYAKYCKIYLYEHPSKKNTVF